MMHSFLGRSFAVVGFAAFLTLAAPRAQAQGNVDACGNIHVEANAMCEVQVEGCDVMCEPVSFRAACSADLWVECDGMCEATVTEVCMEECGIQQCITECELPTFSCEAYCTADISADCSARCEGMADGQEAMAECQASCEATFSAECDAGCEVSGGGCETTCMEVCKSRCRAETSVDCQVDCQAGAYADCYADLQGGCEADCSDAGGALFCDGEYVDHGGNLDMCIMALEEQLNIEVDASASGSSDCTGGECMAEGMAAASATCAAAPGAPAGKGGLALLGLALAALVRRRRQRAA